MKWMAFTVSFVLAFLLFAVQPMATKMVLPTLGGTPAVWNTAMLTFQCLLLAGYAYAHVLTQHVPSRRQWMVHGALVAVSFVFLPLAVQLQSSEALIRQPIGRLAWAFLVQMGLPFFTLSATAPLLQAWVSRSQHPLSQTPYVLYSASNAGSMVGLLGYIAVMEPNFTLPQQSLLWSGLYVAGTLLLIGTALRLKPAAVSPQTVAARPPRRTMLGWVWLAFLPSSLSLGVTSYIATDIASVPLLWVVPLSLYLLSFVDAFAARPVLVGWCTKLGPLLGLLALMVYGLQGHQFALTFVFQMIAFGSLAFALHGWLARYKPATNQLTYFYFCMSIGGALGGVLNALVAPLVFNEAFEYPISLVLASVTAFVLWQRTKHGVPQQLRMLLQVAVVMGVATLAFYAVMMAVNGLPVLGTLQADYLQFALGFAIFVAIATARTPAKIYYAGITVGVLLLVTMTQGIIGTEVLFKERSFFGVWRVFESREKNARYMMHNTTIHSAQFIEQKEPLRALSYYQALTHAFEVLPALHQHPIALMGLGAGTIQCFATPQQRMDIFEIDPIVVRLAEDPRMFRYLSECPGTHEVFLGDGRLEIAKRADGRYGVIIMDAFSSDSIPTHLMTLEAIRTYFDKLAPDGVLLLHTTNRHVNLWPLVGLQADALGMVAYGREFDPPEDASTLVNRSFWTIMARNEAAIAPLIAQGWTRLHGEEDQRPWTDDYTNMLPYFNFLRH